MRRSRSRVARRNRRGAFAALLASVASITSGSAVAAPSHATLIGVPRQPYYMAVLPSINRVFTAVYGGREIDAVDAGTRSIVMTIPLPAGYCYPSALIADPATNRLFASVGCTSSLPRSRLLVIDGNTGATISEIATQAESVLAFNPASNRIYLGAGDGISAIDLTTSQEVAHVRLPGANEYAFEMAINTQTNRLYALDRIGIPVKSEAFTVIDLGSGQILLHRPTTYPQSLAIDPQTDRIFLGREDPQRGGQIDIFDGPSNELLSTVTINRCVHQLALNTRLRALYALDGCNDRLASIDADTLDTRWDLPVEVFASDDVSWDLASLDALGRVYVSIDSGRIEEYQEDRPPGVPQNVTASLGTDGSTIHVTWQPPLATADTDPPTRYRVYRFDSHGRAGLMTEVPADRLEALDLFQCAGSHRYYVVALNDSGAGPDSAIASTAAASQRPCPPEHLTASRGSQRMTLDLSWDPSPTQGLNGYRIYRRTSTGAPPSFVGSVGAVTSFRFDAKAFPIGRPLYFQASAIITTPATVIEGATSNIAIGIPIDRSVGLPVAPRITRTANVIEGTAVDWAPGDDEPDPPVETWRIYRSAQSSDAGGVPVSVKTVTDDGGVLVAEVPWGDRTYFDASSCTPDQYYRISAVSAAGESFPSNEGHAPATISTAPCAPHDLKARTSGGTDFLDWAYEGPPVNTFRLDYVTQSGIHFHEDGPAGFDPTTQRFSTTFPRLSGWTVYRVAAIQGGVVGAYSNPASVGHIPLGFYMAIGDSLVSGHGLNPYTYPACKRSTKAYPELVASVMAMKGWARQWDVGAQFNFACSGAHTSGSRDTMPIPIIHQAHEVADFLAGLRTDGVPENDFVSVDGGANDFEFASSDTGWMILCADTPTFESWVQSKIDGIRRSFLGPNLDLQGESILGLILDAGGRPDATVVVQGVYNPIETMDGPALGVHPLHFAWHQGLSGDCSDRHFYDDAPFDMHFRALTRAKWAVYETNVALQQAVRKANALRPANQLGARVRFVSPAASFEGRVQCNHYAGDSLVQEFSFVTTARYGGGDGDDCVHPSESNGGTAIDRGVEVLALLVLQGFTGSTDSDRYHVDENVSPSLYG